MDALDEGTLEGRLRELEELPNQVEAYLRDLPYLIGRQRVVRDYGTVPEVRTPDRVRRKTKEEIKGEHLAAENERTARLRSLYEAIGLTVTAHNDGTLLLRWSRQAHFACRHRVREPRATPDLHPG